jgi:signal transduction histidine kinase
MQTEELQSMMQELETAADDLRAANVHIEQARVEAEHGRAAADAANRTKSEFLAAMSHELRTPLNAIAGYTDLLDTGVYGGLDERQRGALERIRRNQHHLLALINNVLNFSRLEAGRIDLDIRPVPIEETVRDLHVLIEPQLRTQQLDYEFAGCDAGEAALGDREKIEQILLNLITNAIKFTPPGGRITITCDAAGDTVAITVRDTGRGVPADRLAAIFEPFIQIDAVHTRESGGVGLGLSISRDLARLMDGDVTAASRVGEGSTFTLTLPRATQTEVPQQDSPAGGGSGHAG